MQRPTGLSGVRAVFGDERPFVGPDGHLDAQWEMATLGRLDFPAPLPLSWDMAHEVTRTRCHRLLVPVLRGVFGGLHDRGEWDLLTSWGGCYADRAQRGAARRSLHSWGIALDLNVGDNEMGTPGNMPVQVVDAFEEAGFVWGGRWSGHRHDPMHFQFAEGS